MADVESSARCGARARTLAGKDWGAERLMPSSLARSSAERRDVASSEPCGLAKRESLALRTAHVAVSTAVRQSVASQIRTSSKSTSH